MSGISQAVTTARKFDFVASRYPGTRTQKSSSTFERAQEAGGISQTKANV
jgi:hypothetical protein